MDIHARQVRWIEAQLTRNHDLWSGCYEIHAFYASDLWIRYAIAYLRL